MQEHPYDRTAAIAYARRWAFDRNPAYYNFDKIRGDYARVVSEYEVDKPLDSYVYGEARFLHIDGVRVW